MTKVLSFAVLTGFWGGRNRRNPLPILSLGLTTRAFSGKLGSGSLNWSQVAEAELAVLRAQTTPSALGLF